MKFLKNNIIRGRERGQALIEFAMIITPASDLPICHHRGGPRPRISGMADSSKLRPDRQLAMR